MNIRIHNNNDRNELFFTRTKGAGALGKKSSSSLVFQYIVIQYLFT